MSVGISDNKPLSLCFKDDTIEIVASQIPIFTSTTLPIIKELNLMTVQYHPSIKSSLKLRNQITDINETIEALGKAKDHKTRNIVIGTLKGIVYVAVIATTVFTGILTFGAASSATTATAIPAIFGFGAIVSFGLAVWNVNRSVAVSDWAHVLLAFFLAPFAPTYRAFTNTARLENEISEKKAALVSVMSTLFEFYSNKTNVNDIEQKIQRRLSEYKSAAKKIESDPDLHKNITDKIAIYQTAANEFKAAHIYFTNCNIK